MEHCKPVRCKCIAQIFLCALLISNSVICREIWKKHALGEVFEKLTRACFFSKLKIALEIY